MLTEERKRKIREVVTEDNIRATWEMSTLGFELI